MNKLISTIATLIAILGLSLLFSCGGGGGGGSSTPPPPPPTPPINNGGGESSTSANGLIGPNGGRVGFTVGENGGTELEVPSGALNRDVKITISVTTSGAQKPLDILPSGLKFAVPAKLTVKISKSELSSFGTDIPYLSTFSREDADWEVLENVGRGDDRVSVRVNHLSRFKVEAPGTWMSLDQPSMLIDPPVGVTTIELVSKRRILLGSVVTTPTTVVRYIGQGTVTDLLKTGGCVVVHGIGSNPWEMEALIQALGSIYKNVIAFQYPSARSIEENAESLRRSIQSASPTTKIDIVAHSMGGLVTRKAVQLLGSKGIFVKNVFTIGTPHKGAIIAKVVSYFVDGEVLQVNSETEARAKDFPGLADLDPSSEFLSKLNASSALSTKYFSIAGDYINGGDSVVTVDSATGNPWQTDKFTVIDTHSGLHKNAATNGVIAKIKEWIKEGEKRWIWTKKNPSNSPSPRFGHTMAYDTKRKVTVLFGGNGGTRYYSDTWEWDGIDWVKANPQLNPPPRNYHAMAYDSDSKVIVMFGGGYGQFQLLDDTWEWDGTIWTKRNPANKPQSSIWHSMAYDSKRKVTVLYGGSTGSKSTWEWDGTNWKYIQTAYNPAGENARQAATMVYDPTKGKTVLFGGIVHNEMSDLWEWDGLNWKYIDYSNVIERRQLHCMIFNGENMVVFGGFHWLPTTYFNDTWILNGFKWSEITPQSSPEKRIHHAMAYDSDRKAIVMFGGEDPSRAQLFDTWELEYR